MHTYTHTHTQCSRCRLFYSCISGVVFVIVTTTFALECRVYQRYVGAENYVYGSLIADLKV